MTVFVEIGEVPSLYLENGLSLDVDFARVAVAMPVVALQVHDQPLLFLTLTMFFSLAMSGVP